MTASPASTPASAWAPIPPETLKRAARILVIKLDELGDFVLVTPFLRGLRAAAPQARIMMAVTAPVLALADGCPDVDAMVTPVGDVAGGRFSFRGRTPDDVQAFAAAFRAGFDLVVTPRFDVDRNGAATLAAASRAPVRLGYSERVTPWKADGNRGFDAAYTHPLAAGPVRHEVERNLDLLAALGAADPGGGAVDIHLTAAEREAAAVLLGHLPGGRPRRLLAVAPTTVIPRKNYPIDRFADLADRVVRELGIDGAVLLGTAEGAPRAAHLSAALPCATLDLTGRTGVREAAAVIAAADALLAVDTGPAHMAAAVGTPVAVLFCQPEGGDPQSPYAPERFRPWGRDVLVLQPPHATAPCIDKCLSSEAHCIAAIDPATASARIAAFFAPKLDGRAPRR
ncbi:glycosyltransferase family 9 protein [Azospirillum agricola]|uniref:glycosyltransferase family 9 protein n=1 Tax=Azospirillum agricola TaxID=1720247 RepID=UPI000A0EF088|nr:glycosyltransferase family 9 protein [Azospirillum agricola]SMH30838.1 ADP-heptose:LPS heptosyltransferase [Azospirillum lipoferum]